MIFQSFRNFVWVINVPAKSRLAVANKSVPLRPPRTHQRPHGPTKRQPRLTKDPLSHPKVPPKATRYKGHQGHPKSRISPPQNQQKPAKNEVVIRSLLACVSMFSVCRFGYVKMWSNSLSAVASWSPEDTQAPTSDPKILPTRIPRLTDDPLRPPTVSPIDPRATQGPHKVTP